MKSTDNKISIIHPSSKISKEIISKPKTRADLKKLISISIKKRTRREIVDEIPCENGDKE